MSRDRSAGLTPRWLRRVVAAGVLASIPISLLGAFAALFLETQGLVLAGLGAAAAAPVVVAVVLRGRWSTRSWVVIEAGGVVVFALVLGVVVALAAAHGLHAWADRRPFGETTATAATWGLLAAGGLIALTLLVATVPVERPRRSVLAGAGLLSAAAVLGVLSAGAAASDGGCATFRFDHGRWRAALGKAFDPGEIGRVGDAERLAIAIDRCRTLEGRSRADVLRLLGPGTEGPGLRTNWSTGLTGDLIGPGDDGSLSVAFDRRRRAVDVAAPW